jgi:hypothetical protein
MSEYYGLALSPPVVECDVFETKKKFLDLLSSSRFLPSALADQPTTHHNNTQRQATHSSCSLLDCIIILQIAQLH